MYTRLLTKPLLQNKSFFLFGPRGTGKTQWVRDNAPNALYIDFLEAKQFNTYFANPQLLEKTVPSGFDDWVVLDEVQKVPAILDEVHRLIEKYKYKFILTGSSARSFKRSGANMLAGRALTYNLHPLTIQELGNDFDLKNALRFGTLPAIPHEPDPEKFLASYVKTYLFQEVKEEGLTRNIGNFARFLESASFSQGSILNMSEIARDCSVNQKVVTSYFEILQDMLLSYHLPVFTKRAKRRMIAHPKFYFFDVGIFRALRPLGPLDTPHETDGHALETLFLEQLRAINDYFEFNYKLYYWRTVSQQEVDFIAYGQNGMHAFEIKRSNKISNSDFRGLKALHNDYPIAKRYLIYTGNDCEYYNDVQILPIEKALRLLPKILAPQKTS